MGRTGRVTGEVEANVTGAVDVEVFGVGVTVVVDVFGVVVVVGVVFGLDGVGVVVFGFVEVVVFAVDVVTFVSAWAVTAKLDTEASMASGRA